MKLFDSWGISQLVFSLIYGLIIGIAAVVIGIQNNMAVMFGIIAGFIVQNRYILMEFIEIKLLEEK